MGIPSSSIDPEFGGINPVSMRMVVDLPAPFGPRNPKKQPRGTVRLSPSTAALFPYTLRRSRTRIAGDELSIVSPIVVHRPGAIVPLILADRHYMGLSIATTIITKDRILGSLDKLPPFSPVLTRLLATLADEDVSFGELAAIIETDAILAGNLLRVVNSALYG